MATTTHTAPDARLRPIDEAPEVRAALARFEPIAKRAALLDERVRRYIGLTDAHHAQHHPYPDVDELLEAVAELPAARVAQARALRELREADAALQAARDAERERLRATFRERRRRVAPQVLAAWQAARTAHVVWAALIAEEGALLGSSDYDLLVAGLLQPTAQQGAPFDEWVAALRRAGLLDE